MDTETLYKVINHINKQIDMINGYALNNQGGLTEAEAISAIAGRNTLKQLRDYLQEYIELQISSIEQ
jgi:DNA-binding IscR family transcriptional regulator